MPHAVPPATPTPAVLSPQPEPVPPPPAAADHRLVGLCQAAMGGAVVLWALFWPIPTEVVGKGVILYPDNAGVVNARAAGQVRRVRVREGEAVRRGQVLLELHLPVLERELQQQRGNLAQLERQNRSLDERDRLRLASEREAVDTALAKLDRDAGRYRELQGTYGEKLSNLRWLTRREVVAPLAPEVVTTEQGFTTAGVNLDQVRIDQKRLLSEFQQVKLALETEALGRRYRLDDLRRRIRVTEARLAYDGRVPAERDGRVLDLQVIPGQTVAVGQRLGTLGHSASASASDGDGDGDGRLRAVAYFPPADARRLQVGLPVEVVPLWNQRSRFGGIVGRVVRVLTLPATEEDISTTVGNPQLARSLVEAGPVMRSEIALERDPRSLDGFRWTLSRGSEVFPVREGLTVAAHAYVEWRSPITYVLPGVRTLTGGYRTPRLDRRWDTPDLRQPGTPP